MRLFSDENLIVDFPPLFWKLLVGTEPAVGDVEAVDSDWCALRPKARSRLPCIVKVTNFHRFRHNGGQKLKKNRIFDFFCFSFYGLMFSLGGVAQESSFAKRAAPSNQNEGCFF